MVTQLEFLKADSHDSVRSTQFFSNSLTNALQFVYMLCWVYNMVMTSQGCGLLFNTMSGSVNCDTVISFVL